MGQNYTGSVNSNWCISDEHFFMIEWHSNQKLMIGIIAEIYAWSINFDFINLTHLAFTTLERKGTKKFKEGRRDAPIIMPDPCLSGSKKLSIRAFIWGIVCFFTRVGFFRILKKAGELRLQSLFLFFLKQKSDRNLTEFSWK